MVQMWELRQPVLPRLRTPRACLPCPPPPSPSPCARLPQVAPDDVAACSSGLKVTEAQRAYPQLFAMSGSAPPIRSAAIVAVSQWDVAMCSAVNLPHAPVAPSRAPPSSGSSGGLMSPGGLGLPVHGRIGTQQAQHGAGFAVVRREVQRGPSIPVQRWKEVPERGR